jgi:hypothetical protein
LLFLFARNVSGLSLSRKSAHPREFPGAIFVEQPEGRAEAVPGTAEGVRSFKRVALDYDDSIARAKGVSRGGIGPANGNAASSAMPNKE